MLEVHLAVGYNGGAVQISSGGALAGVSGSIKVISAEGQGSSGDVSISTGNAVTGYFRKSSFRNWIIKLQVLLVLVLLLFNAGDSDSGNGGDVKIASGSSSQQTGGDLILSSGNGVVDTGSVNINTGMSFDWIFWEIWFYSYGKLVLLLLVLLVQVDIGNKWISIRFWFSQNSCRGRLCNFR